MALAHAIENKVEGAYRRGALMIKPMKLMVAWAAYRGMSLRVAASRHLGFPTGLDACQP